MTDVHERLGQDPDDGIADYEPFDVRIVQDGNGRSHPEPPRDWGAPELDQLRWQAGVEKARHGVPFIISTDSDAPGRWVIHVGDPDGDHAETDFLTFQQAWRAMLYIGMGWDAAHTIC